ncbi:tubulin polyglutamylase TTLL4 [Trichonephila clavipes]|nr:tubulin polyglutamylase TTLL4 [Trichonephila clavipes]
MPKTLVCLAETVPFYTQDLCTDSPFSYSSFPANSSPASTCLKSEELDPLSDTRDENHCMNGNCPIGRNTSKPTLPRKREASNILIESVKRRDNLRNIVDSPPIVPYDSLNCDQTLVTLSDENSILSEKECLIQSEPFNFDSSINMESDSSVTDSGIESSKNNSPTHSIDNSSTYCLDEDICHDLMEIDVKKSTLKSEKEDSKIVQEIEDSPKLVEFSTAHLDGLHLTDALLTLSEAKAEIQNAKPPFIQSFFKNVPSVICFSTKDEIVSAMPDNVLQVLKWKLSTITPAIIRQTILKTGFSLIDANTTEPWIGTWGKHLKNSSFKRIKKFQKV